MSRYSLLIILTICTTGHAEIYKWVDENGKVHFSDKEQQGAEKIELEPESVTPGNDGGPSTQQINQRIKQTNNKLGAQRNRENAQQAYTQKREQARQKKNKKTCQYYRDKLANLEYRWKLQNSGKGYKASQKNKYLVKKDQYQRDIKRNC